MNRKIAKRLLNNSNYLQLVGTYEDLHLSELWFFCEKCKRLLPPEKLYMCQREDKEGPDITIQDVCSFIREDTKGNIGGLNDEFKTEGRTPVIKCLCNKCLESAGFGVDDISIAEVDHPRSVQ